MSENDLNLSEAIADLRSLLAEAKPTPWHPSEMVPSSGKGAYESHEEIVAALSKSVGKGGLRFHGVSLDERDEEGKAAWACHTGNGPTSEVHARLIARARMWLPQLLDDLDRLRRLEGQLRALMADSEGVAHLHQSGDVAPWSELVETGWLNALEE